MLRQQKSQRKVREMKKPSEVFSKIRFAKLDPKHEKAGKISTDDEEHYTIGEKEWEQQVAHVKKRAMQEQNDTVEKNEMVQSQLHFIKYACEEILEYINMGGEVEEWYQVKVAKSFSEFESLHAFMEGESRRKGMKEEVEQLDELSPQTISSYKTQAQKSITALKPHAEKGEYRDIAKNIMQRRTKGLAAAMKREEVEQLDEKNVPTSPEKWAQAKAQAKAKFDVYPSAYANGWAAKKYKEMGGGWKSVSEEVEQIDELKKSTLVSYINKAADNARVKKDAAASSFQYKYITHGMKKSAEGDRRLEGIKSAAKRLAKEETNINEVSDATLASYKEKAKKSADELESQKKFGKALTRRTGILRAVGKQVGRAGQKIGSLAKEETEPPFKPTKTKQKVIAGKHGAGYSTARHLARMALKKQVEKMKKMPIKEESRKAAIVKDIMKKKTEPEDKFQANPTLTSQVQKVDNAVT